VTVSYHSLGPQGPARPAAARPVWPGRCSTAGRRRPAAVAQPGGIGRIESEGLSDLLLLLRSAGPVARPAPVTRPGGKRTSGLPNLFLLLRSAGPQPDATGRRQTDGLPDLLLLLRSDGPCGPAGRRRPASSMKCFFHEMLLLLFSVLLNI
jgi:hypothetical protein